MNGEEIYAFLRSKKSEFKKFGVKKIGLFGSYGKNQQNDYSDIDVLVEFENGYKTFDNYMELKFFLEDKFNKKVDLVIAKNIKEELKEEILGSVRYA